MTASFLRAGGSDAPLVSEAPVAVVCNGATLGVMMASPMDLEDFALGFALSEGILRSLDEVVELEIVTHPKGHEARLWLRREAVARVAGRQRAFIGPVGCGLCGIDSLEEASRTLPRLAEGPVLFSRSDVAGATDLLRHHQPEHDRTRACHAAGFLRPGEGIVLAREDVGRHNALDKLAGAIARRGIDPASGAVVLTSRVSSELVQKTVAMGVPVLIAVSRATDLAVALAEAANLTLVTSARGDRAEVTTAASRIATERLPFR